MNVSAGSERREQAVARPAEQEATIRAAGTWINHLARTLKTCRLYDANNPTVVRFRDELAQALTRLLEEHGSITYKFSSDDVFFEDASLYPARSRDDNLALAFYRDGIHALTFSSGVEAPEVEAFLDAILQVTGQNTGDNDLVTLLWETHLPHIEVDYVPAEGEVGAGGPVEGQDGQDPAPWPSFVATEEDGEAAPAGAAGPAAGRSDDWSTGNSTVEVEAGFEELESLAPGETQRFLREYQAEHQVDLVTATIAVASAFVHAESGPADRVELSRFLPRVLRQAVMQGAWAEARETLALLRECEGEWSVETFTQELFQPVSIASAVERLDLQDPAAIAEFVEFAKELGDPAVDWLNLTLAESQQRKTRRLLAEAIAHLCRDNPERLAPWLSDPRWYVVRNVVHILGWIGGNQIVGLLQVALRHPEPRVRQEVVAALGQADPAVARPLLLHMLEGADTRMFCSVLHHLSIERDEKTANLMLTFLVDPEFEQRPLEERRAVYSTLAATGGDAVVPALEVELHRGNWLSRFQEAHRQSVARCLARVGTPLARAVLERGARSKRAPVRKACEDALGGFEDHA
ncbi:MAG: HEAT repeat domain-containing protein [Candidatus Eisenbacteria bacterium]|nr:HEAT repeat domain-containing protein [Candidatus Eisenbacteria bacterium]